MQIPEPMPSLTPGPTPPAASSITWEAVERELRRRGYRPSGEVPPKVGIFPILIGIGILAAMSRG
ncbi:MAG: hypothetical protein DRP95_00090 [Candidatus Latescibacterota bacterium]|nr:MAG: hypothetical protein DRP95_00090 [Candidatus Latescibacterota bacterium]